MLTGLLCKQFVVKKKLSDFCVQLTVIYIFYVMNVNFLWRLGGLQVQKSFIHISGCVQCTAASAGLWSVGP